MLKIPLFAKGILTAETRNSVSNTVSTESMSLTTAAGPVTTFHLLSKCCRRLWMPCKGAFRYCSIAVSAQDLTY